MVVFISLSTSIQQKFAKGELLYVNDIKTFLFAFGLVIQHKSGLRLSNILLYFKGMK